MESLLLEIGTEEIPAGYIGPALEALAQQLTGRLNDWRIPFAAVETFGTPRRLAVRVDRVAVRQQRRDVEVMGPPERVGYDERGEPTVAAQKFAEKVGVGLDRLQIRETEKGRYLFAVQADEGQTTADLLAGFLPEAILSLPFPKTMKWADLDMMFARPIQWILALFGKKVLPFSLGNLTSGRHTLGHRFLHPKRISIADPSRYVSALRDAGVIADEKERRDLLQRRIREAAKNAGGKLLEDPELVDIVCNLVEYPAVSCGRFDLAFLELPDEVLITAMREHQKYFSIVDVDGALMPSFIAVNNTSCRDMDLVTSGHQRVLRARLSDAQFFFRSDLNVTLNDRLEKLKGVLFQQKLGSMYEKVKRVEKIVQHIADALALSEEERKHVTRAARFAKTDLVSHVVVEFPKLQGVMGRIYAEAAGEPPSVSRAIEEHYRPTHSGGALPETILGAILGVADKIDSICGCFTAGLIPTGASDPYALRRQGIGLVQIALDRDLPFSLDELVAKSLKLFGPTGPNEIRRIGDQVIGFFRNRIEHMLTEEGYSRDLVQAVTAVSIDRIPDLRKKVAALQSLKRQPDFEPLAIAFKRVVNIIRKSGAVASDKSMGSVDPALFEKDCESALLESCRRVTEKVRTEMAEGLFEAALLDIAGLKTAIDAFFDGVMVMSDNARLRDNRLALLGSVAGLFEHFADFSKIST